MQTKRVGVHAVSDMFVNPSAWAALQAGLLRHCRLIAPAHIVKPLCEAVQLAEPSPLVLRTTQHADGCCKVHLPLLSSRCCGIGPCNFRFPRRRGAPARAPRPKHLVLTSVR